MVLLPLGYVGGGIEGIEAKDVTDALQKKPVLKNGISQIIDRGDGRGCCKFPPLRRGSNGLMVNLIYHNDFKKALTYKKNNVALGKKDFDSKWIIEILPRSGCLKACNELTENSKIRFRHVMSGKTLHFNLEMDKVFLDDQGYDGTDIWYVRNNESFSAGAALDFEASAPKCKQQGHENKLECEPRFLQARDLMLDDFARGKAQKMSTVICSKGQAHKGLWMITPSEAEQLRFPEGRLKITGAWYGKLAYREISIDTSKAVAPIATSKLVARVSEVTDQVRNQFENDGYILVPGGTGGVMNGYFGIDKTPSDRALVVACVFDGGAEFFICAGEGQTFTFTYPDAQDLFAQNRLINPGDVLQTQAGKQFKFASDIWMNYVKDYRTSSLTKSKASFNVLGAWYGPVGALKEARIDVSEAVRMHLDRDGDISITGGEGAMNAYVEIDPNPGTRKNLVIEIACQQGNVPLLFSVGELDDFFLTSVDVRELAAKHVFDSQVYWPRKGGRKVSLSNGKQFTILHPSDLWGRQGNEMFPCVEPNWDDDLMRSGKGFGVAIPEVAPEPKLAVVE